jgi:hypothetical protein
MYPAKYVVIWKSKNGLVHKRYYAFPWSQKKVLRRMMMCKDVVELWTAEVRDEYINKRFIDRLLSGNR